jgi:hypothetical protein
MRQAVRIKLLIKGTMSQAEYAAAAHGIELGDVTQTKCKDQSFYCEAFVDESYQDAVRIWFAAADHKSLAGYSLGSLLWFAIEEQAIEHESEVSHAG